MADIWIRETVCLSNSTCLRQAPYPTYGRYNEDRREAAAARLADGFLASGPIQPLLELPTSDEDAKKRRDDLVTVYRRAADAAVHSDKCTGQTMFLRLDNEHPMYDTNSERLTALTSQGLSNEEARLHGNKVLLVVRPGLLRKLNKDSTPFRTWVRAMVMVEDDKMF